MSAFIAANVAHTLSILNALIAGVANEEEYRAIISKAIAEGRDVSNEELQAVSDKVAADIKAAEES
jgi:hypothetical protein